MATNSAGSTGYTSRFDVANVRSAFFTYSDLAATSDTSSKTVCVLPPGALILSGTTYILEGFDDTNGDDLHVGTSADPDLYDTSVDMNSVAVTAWNSLAASERYSTSERTVTCNLETAASGDGTAGKVLVVVEYVVISENSGITQ